ncbi:MAG: PAS domain S-box protein, partial [Gallionella sp.]|nr:PAS domain S-box protein [Gallionella sp.]
MLEPATPFDEASRLATLRGLEILDTPPEERFDRLTRLAQYIFGVPVALVSLVDSNRQWFKSCQGLDVSETPRSISFCGHAILDDQVFIVPDTLLDPRFADNPLVTSAPHIRFYAGHPLKAKNGSRLGTLCVIDSRPHHLSPIERDCLRDLAQCVSDELERDVRQAYLTEQALIQARYGSIIASSDDAIMSKSLDGIITSWNPAAERLFGYTEQEAIGQPMLMLFPEERADEEASILARIRNGERIHHFETTRIRKDGSKIDVSVSISPLLNNKGEVIGASKIVRDITERKLAAQAKLEDENRLAAILDNVLDGIITINEVGSVASFNKAAENIFGYSAAEVIGHNVKMLMPEPYHSEHDGYLHNHMSTGTRKIIGIGRQVVGQRRDGSTFPMDLAVSAMQLGSKRMFTGIVRDITERVRTERMKSEFISTVSHELRTPLTSIRGSLGLLAGGLAGALPAQVKTLIDIAHKNSERLILLVNDILDMEKIEAGKMEFLPAPTRLIPLLHQAIEGNRAYAEQFGVVYELTDALPDVDVNLDADRWQQVLSNLLSNAAKFSPAGDRVILSATSDGERVRITVSDHGSGIPAQFQSRIFEKFSQADSSDTRKKGGTGLGLSITKSLVEQMGACIGFESQPDVLTTFWVEFPVWHKKLVPESDHSGAGKRVLVCEDDQDIASLLCLMLEQAGLSADVAGTAMQAKQMLALHDYAAMTLDLGLPDQNGLSLIRELRAAEKTATLPIIVVSANAEKGGRELSGEAFCIIDWITKPIDRDRLESALTRAMGKFAATRAKVLHIEDDLDISRVVHAIVGEFVDMDNAGSLAEARILLKQKCYDLVIMDITLPDGTGMDLLNDLNSSTPPIPVMVFSAHEMGLDAIRQVGASLVKSR